MAKLGEARLGSTQFATPTAFQIETFDARERAEENMKNPFPTHEGTVWDQVLSTILLEFEIQNQVIDDIIDERFIDNASRYQLNMIGRWWGVERRANEGDELYRARIKNQIPRHTSSTTINQILESSANLLQTDKSRLQIEEHHEPKTLLEFDDEEIPDEWYDMWEWFKHEEDLLDGWTTQEQEDWITNTLGATLPDNWNDDSEWSYLSRDAWVRNEWVNWVDPNYSGLPSDWDTLDDDEQLDWMREQWIAYKRETLPTEVARFDLAVEDIVLHEAGVSVEDFEGLLQDIKAAGVRAVATVGSQFTYRSVGDDEDGINDSEKGYGGYDHETIDWPEQDNDNAGYSHDEYGDVYGSPIYLHESGTVTDDSQLLDIGGGYADEITSQL